MVFPTPPIFLPKSLRIKHPVITLYVFWNVSKFVGWLDDMCALFKKKQNWEMVIARLIMCGNHLKKEKSSSINGIAHFQRQVSIWNWLLEFFAVKENWNRVQHDQIFHSIQWVILSIDSLLGHIIYQPPPTVAQTAP